MSTPQMSEPGVVTPAALAESPLLDRVGYLLAKTHARMHERGNQLLAPVGLDVKQWGSLVLLREKGPLSQQALAEKVGSDRTTMVAIVDRLEASGYVKRRRNAADRRAYALEITDAGVRAHSKGAKLMASLEDELLAPLSASERTLLLDMLKRVLLAGA